MLLFKEGTLSDKIASEFLYNTRFDKAIAYKWIFELITAVNFLHNQIKMLHRDIKPKYLIVL